VAQITGDLAVVLLIFWATAKRWAVEVKKARAMKTMGNATLEMTVDLQELSLTPNSGGSNSLTSGPDDKPIAILVKNPMAKG
jgi:hypothetical protein